MEKYRQFGDGGTGVHPFTPAWSSRRTPLLLRLLKVFFVPIALLRLLLFALAMLWLGITEMICTVIPIGFIRYPIYRALTYIGCFVALLALGIFSFSDEIADHRRLKIAPPKGTASKVFDASRGALVFVNHQGLTDVLLLGLKMSPVFVIPASDGTPVKFTLLGALCRATSIKKELAPKHSSGSLNEIAAKAKASWQQVAVFPEGSRTIGNSVLAWKEQTFKGVESFSAGAAVLSIQYSKTGAYTPHHTVGTGLMHLFWLCMSMPHTVSTVWLPSRDVAAALKDKTIAEQVAFLRTLLVRMIKDAVEVAVGADTHLEFMAFYRDAQSKGYTAKKTGMSQEEMKRLGKRCD